MMHAEAQCPCMYALWLCVPRRMDGWMDDVFNLPLCRITCMQRTVKLMVSLPAGHGASATSVRKAPDLEDTGVSSICCDMFVCRAYVCLLVHVPTPRSTFVAYCVAIRRTTNTSCLALFRRFTARGFFADDNSTEMEQQQSEKHADAWARMGINFEDPLSK